MSLVLPSLPSGQVRSTELECAGGAEMPAAALLTVKQCQALISGMGNNDFEPLAGT